MYGTQAVELAWLVHGLFENDVNMYGTQAKKLREMEDEEFENDVNMYGTQASVAPVQQP